MRYGTLYTVDFEGVSEDIVLNDPDNLVSRMARIITESGLQAVGQPLVHRFSPHGLTYIVMLAQSHLAVHTWPETRFVSVDFFTCGTPEDGERAFEALQQSIPADHIHTSVVDREDSTP